LEIITDFDGVVDDEKKPFFHGAIGDVVWTGSIIVRSSMLNVQKELKTRKKD